MCHATNPRRESTNLELFAPRRRGQLLHHRIETEAAGDKRMPMLEPVAEKANRFSFKPKFPV